MMKSEFDSIRTVPVSTDELKWAKDSLVNRFIHLLDDTMAMRLMTLEIQGMPGDYYKTYVKGINSVTLEEVKRVAAEYLHPDRMTILVVGDRNRLGSQLHSLGEVKEIKLEESKE